MARNEIAPRPCVCVVPAAGEPGRGSHEHPCEITRRSLAQPDRPERESTGRL